VGPTGWRTNATLKLLPVVVSQSSFHIPASYTNVVTAQS